MEVVTQNSKEQLCAFDAACNILEFNYSSWKKQLILSSFDPVPEQT